MIKKNDMKMIMQGEVKIVPLSEVQPDPNQPRQEFNDSEMRKLVNSIKERGILTPITVEPKFKGKYNIVDGERRYRSAKELHIKAIPLNILPRPLDESEKNIVRFHLQETHQNWTIFEKAEAMITLRDRLGIDSDSLAKVLSLDQKTCKDYLSILTFPLRIRQLAIKERIPFTYLRAFVWLNNAMPTELKKSVPNFMEKTIDKYKKGFITAAKDLGVITRILKNGETEVVKKFFSQLSYTANNAISDSNLSADRFLDSISYRSRTLLRDMRVLNRNKSKFDLDDVTLAVLKTLKSEISKVV